MSTMLLDSLAQVVRVNSIGRFARWAVCATISLHMALALAKHQAGGAPDILHQVQAGETLSMLAERYTGQSNRWLQLQQLNRIADRYRLLPGTQVRIPAALLAVKPAFARVAYVMGEVRHILPRETQARPLENDAQLPEGTRLEVGANGFVRLQMVDGSIVRLPAGSRARLVNVRHQEATHVVETIIQMEAGRVDATVHPNRNKSSRFEIHTPLTVASVRGTEFGVAIQPDATVTSEVTQGIVGLQGRRRGQNHPGGRSQRLQTGQGARVDSTGVVGPVRSLPEAPNLSALPATVTDADFVRLPLPVIPGISAYRVRISSDEALEQVLRDVMANGKQVQLIGVDDGNYMVGVRAVDDVGLLGRESRHALRVKARPVAPLFQRPAPDEKVVGNAIELTCTQPAEVQRFRLQIAKDEAFQAPVVDESALSECRHQATLPPGQYFWRLASVRLVAGGAPDQGPFSGSQRFELVAPPPAAPVPAVSSDDEALKIHWPSVTGHSYLIQIARDSRFANLVHNETQTKANLDLPGQTPGTYYIRIQAIDAQGQAGAFSPAQVVQIDGVLRSSYSGPVRGADNKAVGRQ